MKHLGKLILSHKLHKIDKALLYDAFHYSSKVLQERIDEEGCGAVFCAARLLEDK